MTHPSPAPAEATDERLATYLAAMAAGDAAYLFAFCDAYGDRLAGTVRSLLREFGRHDLTRDPDTVAELVLDAAFVIYDRASGWRPGRAAPWTWARSAIRAQIAAAIGHRCVELDAEHHDHPEPAPARSGDVWARAVAADPAMARLDHALRHTASDRDQAVVIEYCIQQSLGDPSPAHTVAAHLGLSAVNVRQIVSRTRRRLRRLLADDPARADDGGWLAA